MSATIHTFPTRRVQPHALDFSRAIPADDAAIEALRRHTRAAMAARTQVERAELVSALLLHLDNNPLAPCHCYAVRDIQGKGHVAAHVAGQTFRLDPDDARTAAQALIAENAFPGCVGVAANLRETAAVAELRQARGGPVFAADDPALKPRRTASGAIAHQETSGRTGFASTAALAGLILLMLAVSVLASGAQGASSGAGTRSVASVSAQGPA